MKKQNVTLAVVAAFCASVASAAAQTATTAAPVPAVSANPLVDAAKAAFEGLKSNLSKSAAKMSDEQYGFRPTPDVRSFGQLIGHLANANYNLCAAAIGEKSPSAVNVEKTMTTKADLVKALGDAFAYCDGVYAKLDDAKALELVTFRTTQPRAAVLFFNNSHNNEHYGNVVTYLRLNGIVPPSSEGR